jgi:hypothetical protein
MMCFLLQVMEKHNQYKRFREEVEAFRKVTFLCAVSSQKLLSCVIRDIQLDYLVAVHVFSLLLITLDAHRKKRNNSSSLCGERWYPLHNPCQSIPNPLCH